MRLNKVKRLRRLALAFMLSSALLCLSYCANQSPKHFVPDPYTGYKVGECYADKDMPEAGVKIVKVYSAGVTYIGVGGSGREFDATFEVFAKFYKPGNCRSLEENLE